MREVQHPHGQRSINQLAFDCTMADRFPPEQAFAPHPLAEKDGEGECYRSVGVVLCPDLRRDAA